MGSKTDFKVMKKAADVLNDLKVPNEVKIVSAHRTPLAMVEFAQTAREKGFGVIIAGAGGSAHLPGMVACLTTLPVVGVPVTVGKLDGLDAVLSIVQMPKGVPVATVAADNAVNAGLLAARMLSLDDAKLAARLEKYRKHQIAVVKEMNKDIQRASRRK